jgi:hypothetical protein
MFPCFFHDAIMPHFSSSCNLPDMAVSRLCAERQTLSDSTKITSGEGYDHIKCAQEVLAALNMFGVES